MKRFLTFVITVLALHTVAQPVLVDVAQQVGITHHAVMANTDMPGQGGAAWFDYDNDGWYDLYLTGGSASDALYRNNGNGTFSDVTAQSGLSALAGVMTDGVTTGDIDNDGFPELFVTTFRTDVNHLLYNNGNGTFTDLTTWAGQSDTANSFSASFGDLNMDGLLDLFVCNWSRNMELIIEEGVPRIDSESNFYYENIDGTTFVEKAVELGIDDSTGCALGVLITDYDNDHLPDLFIANDFGYFAPNSTNRLYKNQGGSNSFLDVSESTGMDVAMNGMGVAKSDVDLDGRMDYYITNIKLDKLMIHDLDGFEDELDARGLRNDSVWLLDFSTKMKKTGWGVGFFDVDNDMDEDLMAANGDLYYQYPKPSLDSNKLFLNDGAGFFTNVSLQTGVADTYVSRALAYCDYDLDGDIDVFVGVTDSVGGANYSFLYRNDSPPQHWLQVKAEGVQNNRDGIGTKVIIHIGQLTQIREIGGESSFNSQHWTVAHFGLGPNTVVDSMDVIWPGGNWDRYYSVAADQLLEVIEGQGIVTGISRPLPWVRVYPNPFADRIQVECQEQLERVELLAEDGKQVLVLDEVATRGCSIPTHQLSSGKYFLRLTTKDGVILRKLLKH